MISTLTLLILSSNVYSFRVPAQLQSWKPSVDNATTNFTSKIANNPGEIPLTGGFQNCFMVALNANNVQVRTFILLA